MNYHPCVIWLTGLSGSGKTTIANELQKKINKSIILDGDEIRTIFNNNNFSKEARMMHNIQTGKMAALLEKQGFIVIVSLISPYAEARYKCRTFSKKFIEIYINTPLEICEKRDIKGLYVKARKGEIKEFTGISNIYEIPTHPELILNTLKPVAECVNDVLNLLRSNE